MQNDSTSRILWFVTGACVGTALGVVLAPASGAETRRLLTTKAGETSHLVSQSGRDYLSKGRELYEMGCQLADDAAAMFDDGRRLMEGEAYGANRA